MKINETHGKFEDILSVAKPEFRLICQTLRHLIISMDKNIIEIIWTKQKIVSFGVGPKKMTQHYVYISVHHSHINLGFYHGASLADPNQILEGSGKKFRHIKIRNMSAAENTAIVPLLYEALHERKSYAIREC